MKFYELFNLFSRKKDVEQEINDKLAYITYYVDKDGIKIDVNIQNTNDDSIKYLSDLLNTLSSDDFFFSTLKIIENFFLDANEHKSLIKLYSLLDPKIIKSKLKSREENSPYIKPSEMIK